MIRLLLASCVALALQVQAGRVPEDKEEVLEGKLRVAEGKASLIMEPGKGIALGSADENIAATLGDVRLSGRPARVVGRMRPDGGFSVRLFYIVRSGSLYRVVYFCAKCNITTFTPGDCMCCQEPTVPVEVPPTDPRIYHEEAPGPRASSNSKPSSNL